MNKLPKARRDKVVVQELSDEVLVYDQELDKAHCLNQTAALVWKNCDGRSDAPKIARRLCQQLKAPVDERMVWFALELLGRDSLLEERIVPPAAMTKMTRRQMVRMLGLASVVAVPLVTSIVAPLPAQAGTCGGNGTPCFQIEQCCSHQCFQGFCT